MDDLTTRTTTAPSVSFQATVRDLQIQDRVRRASFPGAVVELQRRIAAISVLSVYLLGLVLLFGIFGITLLAAVPFALWALACASFHAVLADGIERRIGEDADRMSWRLRAKTLTLAPDGLEIETGAARELIPWSEIAQIVEDRGQIVFALDARTHHGAPAAAFSTPAEKNAFLDAARRLREA